jgi:uncharacterized protein involved in type VI secretion and phage assembly
MFLLPGVVTDTHDPEDFARVMVKFPMLGEGIESNWCRLVALGAGSDRGIEFMPEVDDEVLCIGNSVDNLYVLGGLWNSMDLPPFKNSQAAPSGDVEKRVIRSRTGHQILIDDGSDGGITIADSKGNKVQLSTSSGNLDAEVTGDIKLKATGSINIEATGSISLKATADISVEATGTASVKATGAASLEGTASTGIRSGGVVTLSGSAISLG